MVAMLQINAIVEAFNSCKTLFVNTGSRGNEGEIAIEIEYIHKQWNKRFAENKREYEIIVCMCVVMAATD